MITGDGLRQARERRGWTQEQLATAVGVTQRSIGNWERGEVPSSKEARLREVLGDLLTPGGNPLAQASDLALISELARRLEQRGLGGQRDGRTPDAEKSDDGPIAVTTRDETMLSARHAPSEGKLMKAEADRLGEESQDDGEWHEA